MSGAFLTWFGLYEDPTATNVNREKEVMKKMLIVEAWGFGFQR